MYKYKKYMYINKKYQIYKYMIRRYSYNDYYQRKCTQQTKFKSYAVCIFHIELIPLRDMLPTILCPAMD